MDQKSVNTVFMALAIWREARGESIQGQIGVAFSILNRVNRPSWWGKTVMEVLFKKWQYSSLTDPHDPQLTTWPKDDTAWKQCLQIADNVLSGVITENPVPGADSYVDVTARLQSWMTEDRFVKQIGLLKFYNVDKDVEV